MKRVITMRTNINYASGLAEKFFKVRRQDQGHVQTECYNGGGMHLDGVASRITC